jgi:DNA-binding CsgD family transcriptional regulator
MARGLAGGGSWYMFDLRGTLKSSVPPGPVTFEQLVDDAEAVADAIGEPFDLFAVNDGCNVAVGLATRRPELVRRMLLVAPGAANALPEDEYQAYLATSDRLMGLWQFIMWVHPGADPAQCRAMAEETIAGQPPDATAALRKASVSIGVADLASEITAPSLLIDNSMGFPSALALSAVMPFARAADWNHLGDGTINGAAWRRAWDDAIPPDSVAEPWQRRRDERAAEDCAIEELSSREVEVMRLIAAGRTNRQIAAELVLADGTVSRHVHNILTKLGLPNRSAAATWAAARGIRPPH